MVRREFGFLFDRTVVPVPHNKRIFRFAMYSSLTSSLTKFREEINTMLIGLREIARQYPGKVRIDLEHDPGVSNKV